MMKEEIAMQFVERGGVKIEIGEPQGQDKKKTSMRENVGVDVRMDACMVGSSRGSLCQGCGLALFACATRKKNYKCDF